MPKLSVEFEGFNEAIKRLSNLEGDVRQTTEKALKETHRIVTQKAETAAAPHKKTGRTERSMQRQAKVQWAGTLASVETGFNIHNGGLASIFLMYGTPRMRKDQKLYNAFYGSQTRKEVLQAQEEIFMDEIRRLGG